MDAVAAAGVGAGIGAILFLESGMYCLQAASSLMSSPWTAESFGADDRRANSAKEYLAHAVVVSTAAAGIAAYVSHSWWPIVGAIGLNAYLVWIYLRAIGRGRDAGSENWANAPADAAAIVSLFPA